VATSASARTCAACTGWRGAFKQVFTALQRGKALADFTWLGHYVLSMDGTGFHSSESVRCDHCCEKRRRDGTVTYCHQMLGVKPDGHRHLFEWVESTPGARTFETEDANGLKRRYRYPDSVPLNDANFDLEVNFLECRETRPGGKERCFTWVTDIEIDEANAGVLMRAGRTKYFWERLRGLFLEFFVPDWETPYRAIAFGHRTELVLFDTS